MNRTGRLSPVPRTSNALKSSCGSDLKHRDILYALVSGLNKAQIVNQMEELISPYKLQIKQQLENMVAFFKETKR
jgi:hypothetical protein